MRLQLRTLLVLGLSYGLVLAASPLIAPAARAATPRVVIIVGPAGRATDRYRADGDQAAKVARAAGASVRTIYSPNATWPIVKAALQGASIVVYMGHGNGFPSRYGPVLNKATKDGLGLNPIAGIDDDAHQYFGEAYLTRQVRLAPHAVVLLHHLCYASGNSEPGLPEGDLDTGRQRIDNMAAGWLAAGAEAVLAEAYGDPAYYLGKILAGRSTIETIWRTGPTSHDHVLAFPSVRTPGMTGLMDPTRKSSGFYRSIMLRAEMRADEVAAGAALVRKTTDEASPPAPSPSRHSAPTVSSVTLKGVPTVGATLDLALAFGGPASGPPGKLGVGARWDPIIVDPSAPTASPPAAAMAPSATPKPAATQKAPKAEASMPPEARTRSATEPSAPPESSTSPGAPTRAQASPSPEVSDQPLDKPSPSSPSTPSSGSTPSIDPPAAPQLVAPEVLGEVVTLVDVKAGAASLTGAIVAPDAPGLYRLVTTVHDAEGVALDAGAGGPPIPALIVKVTRPLSALIAATRHIDVGAGTAVELPVIVMNSGSTPWVGGETAAVEDEHHGVVQPDPKARLIGRWVRLDASTSPGEEPSVLAAVDPAPGATDVVSLHFVAPVRQGEYLLVLDVVSRLDGSLTANGGEPVVVRVSVAAPGSVGGPRSH